LISSINYATLVNSGNRVKYGDFLQFSKKQFTRPDELFFQGGKINHHQVSITY